MLGTLNPSKIEQLVEDILNRNIDSLKRFINNSAEFEAETIIDELILYLKELLLRGSSMISYQQFGIFFKILEEAKRLLSMGSDGEFVLAITLFKMAESLKRDTIEDGESRDILVESKNQMEDKNSEDIKEIEESFKEPFKKESRKAKEDSDLLKFNALIKKLYNYNMELGEVFEKNIKFISFDGRVLVWESKAIGESREFLKNRFGQIRMYVREVYGEGITIRNISRPNKSQQKKEEQIKTHFIEEIPKERELSNMERWEILKSSEPVIDKVVELFEPHNVILDYKDNLGEVS
jgi:DNA polymerase-3 subunit gamma/tau